MKLKYFGTAAAEGVPALFCDCPVCKFAREHRGRELRTRSQALVDGRLLIDFPADTMAHTLYGGLDLPRIHSCLITHSHIDHLYPAEVENRKEELGHLDDPAPLTFYCSAGSSFGLRDAILRTGVGRQDRVRLQVAEPYRPLDIEGYRVTPLEADHDLSTQPFLYLIERDGKALLYAHDTGWFPARTWDYLREHKPRLDLVSLDSTGMVLKNWRSNHMTLDTNVDLRKEMDALGLTDGNTVWCLNHFSHNGGSTYADYSKKAAEYGFLVSYDGLELTF